MFSALLLAVVLTADPTQGIATLSVLVVCDGFETRETINATKEYVCVRKSIVVNWEAPTQNAPDATHPLPWGVANVTGYRIYYKVNGVEKSIDFPPNVRSGEFPVELGREYTVTMTAWDASSDPESKRTTAITVRT